MTSSYLRAVNVFPLSSKRSKKRQSPAAKRPIVARLTERADEYAEAQAMRLDRSSDSIVGDHSRKIPTLQEQSVGKFRLADEANKSDKSAVMPTVDEVRRRLSHAIAQAGDSPVALAREWEFERNHLRDFLEGRKDSLKPEVLQFLSERYGIPFPQLIITRQKKRRKTA